MVGASLDHRTPKSLTKVLLQCNAVEQRDQRSGGNKIHGVAEHRTLLDQGNLSLLCLRVLYFASRLWPCVLSPYKNRTNEETVPC